MNELKYTFKVNYLKNAHSCIKSVRYIYHNVFQDATDEVQTSVS